MGHLNPLEPIMSDTTPAVQGATELSPERLKTLLETACASILDGIEWDYTGWDGAILDGKITPGEWRWLRDNLPGRMHIVVDLPPDVSMTLDPSEDFEGEGEEEEESEED